MSELDQYVDLLIRRARLTDAIADLNAEIDAIMPSLLATLRAAPDQQIEHRGFILSRSVDVSVRLTNPAAAPTVFRENGLAHLVKTVESIHPSSLRAWVNRWYLQAPNPPDAVMAQIAIRETEAIIVAKVKAAK